MDTDHRQFLTRTNHFDVERDYPALKMSKVDKEQLYDCDVKKFGGFSEVFEYRLDRRMYALKKLKTAIHKSNEALYSEVAILSKLQTNDGRPYNHPNIVTLVGYSAEPEWPLLLFNWCDGLNLFDFKLYGEIEKLTELKKLDLARQLATGMEFVHSKSILHRDLKSTNIMITGYAREGQTLNLKIIDFGMSSTTTGRTQCRTTINEKFAANFHPEPLKLRAAPELTTRHFTNKSDVYAAGFLMYDFLMGKTKVIMSDIKVTDIENHKCLLGKFWKSMETGRSVVDNEFRHVIMRATSFKASNRPEFSEIREQLTTIIEKVIKSDNSDDDDTDSENTFRSKEYHNESLQSQRTDVSSNSSVAVVQGNADNDENEGQRVRTLNIVPEADPVQIEEPEVIRPNVNRINANPDQDNYNRVEIEHHLATAGIERIRVTSRVVGRGSKERMTIRSTSVKVTVDKRSNNDFRF